MNIEKLEQIKEQIKELVFEAKEIIKESNNNYLINKAESHWIAYILTALDNDHEYICNSLITMQDTINNFKKRDTK